MGNKNLKWRDRAWENDYVLIEQIGRGYTVKHLGSLPDNTFRSKRQMLQYCQGLGGAELVPTRWEASVRQLGHDAATHDVTVVLITVVLKRNRWVDDGWFIECREVAATFYAHACGLGTAQQIATDVVNMMLQHHYVSSRVP